MDQSGEYRIAAERGAVWRALNDPGVLGRCINGCLSIEKRAEDEYAAVVKAKVGPVRATFNATLQLAEIDPEKSYTMKVAVTGGAAGFARGSAAVSLAADDKSTVLRYAASANVGGKLAQVGSRLINGAARKLADDFFKAFRLEMSPPVTPDPNSKTEPDPPGSPMRQIDGGKDAK